jgi:hypothetical protein
MRIGGVGDGRGVVGVVKGEVEKWSREIVGKLQEGGAVDFCSPRSSLFPQVL